MIIEETDNEADGNDDELDKADVEFRVINEDNGQGTLVMHV